MNRDYVDSVMEEAVEQGWNAYLRGQIPSDNPYRVVELKPSSLERAWDRGWREAQDQDPFAV